MERTNGRKILEDIIESFSIEKFIHFFREKNRNFRPLSEKLDYYRDDYFTSGKIIGEIEFQNEKKDKLITCAFQSLKELTERSGKKKQYEIGKRILKDTNRDAGIFIFYDRNGNFRFSLIYTEYSGTRRKYSFFKRFTYFVSKEKTNKTFLQQIGQGDFSSLEKIKEAFSVEPVTKQFYEEIQNWYFWAMDKVEFPEDYKYSNDPEKDKEIRNATNLIRLITRLIFIWFIKEKGLIPEILFEPEKLKDIVKDFGKGHNYYNAILQNLFFATLNQKMGERKFAAENGFHTNKKEYGVKTLFRYADKFLIPKEKVLEIFKDIPFLNGGLFDCLDKEDESGKVIYIDGFSRNPKKQAKIPDYLFFQKEEVKVDLSKYGLGSNKKVRGLIEILKSYNFTIDENTPIDQEIALDPELLGKVFENLLACYNPETATTARKATGSYYTPREIVDYMVEESLKEYFKNKFPNIDEQKLEMLLSYSEDIPEFSEEERKKLISSIADIKILDPACGSGAFPMGILQKLVHLLQRLDPDNKYWYELQYERAIKVSEEVFKEKDKVEREEMLKEINEAFDESINYPDYARKLYLIENCIYGVDIQPIAIQISKLRFFISLVIDQKVDKTKENLGIRPLPNLETKFVAANTLIGLERPKQIFQLPFLNQEIEKKKKELKNLRHRYFTAKTRAEKLGLQEKDKKIRQEIAELLIKDGWPDDTAHKIASFDPFDQNSSADWFDPEWMFGVIDGFDIIIGNPPHGANINDYKKYIIEHYKFYETRKNSASLFIEKSFEFLKPYGILSFVVPKSITFVESWEKTRELVCKHNKLLILIDITKSFENVRLEQVIIISQKTHEETYTYKAGDFWGEKIKINNNITIELYDELGILPIYLEENKLDILRKILKDSVKLSHISETFRGLPFQSKISTSGYPILRGENINKYLIYRKIDKVNLTESELNRSKTKQLLKPKIISQNIVAHVMNPSDRIIIMATYDKKGFLTLDTVMNTFLNDNSFSYEYILGILNSRLSEWFYYWFVYNRAIRTMHFDESYIGKLPIKKITYQNQPIADQIIHKVNEILSLTQSENYGTDTSKQKKVKELEKEIDKLVYKLYNLTEEEIKIIEGNI
jgi:adenine-specific DNA-methyltransferase